LNDKPGKRRHFLGGFDLSRLEEVIQAGTWVSGMQIWCMSLDIDRPPADADLKPLALTLVRRFIEEEQEKILRRAAAAYQRSDKTLPPLFYLKRTLERAIRRKAQPQITLMTREMEDDDTWPIT
jgi:hypothetical protein